MPIQFAVLELIPNEGVSRAEAHHWNSTSVYHPALQHVAENDPQGYFSLIGKSGEQVTNWISLARKMKLEEKPMKNNGKPHKDILGEELAVGDFVATSSMDTPDLTVGKVVSFSAKKVRVLMYDSWFAPIHKNASSLIKIQSSELTE